jgi:hypothetical protein
MLPARGGNSKAIVYRINLARKREKVKVKSPIFSKDGALSEISQKLVLSL